MAASIGDSFHSPGRLYGDQQRGASERSQCRNLHGYIPARNWIRIRKKPPLMFSRLSLNLQNPANILFRKRRPTFITPSSARIREPSRYSKGYAITFNGDLVIGGGWWSGGERGWKSRCFYTVAFFVSLRTIHSNAEDVLVLSRKLSPPPTDNAEKSHFQFATAIRCHRDPSTR